MFVFVRAVTFAALFIGFFLIYLPARVLAAAGIVRPAAMGGQQMAGMLIGTAGAAIALWCIFTLAVIGKGTPAPFDPPRRLVIRGPYRFVRNPMYIGAGLALAGAALFYVASEQRGVGHARSGEEHRKSATNAEHDAFRSLTVRIVSGIHFHVFCPLLRLSSAGNAGNQSGWDHFFW